MAAKWAKSFLVIVSEIGRNLPWTGEGVINEREENKKINAVPFDTYGGAARCDSFNSGVFYHAE